MVWADGVKEEAQEKLLHKFCVALGFHAVNVKYIADKALELVKNGVDSRRVSIWNKAYESIKKSEL